VRTFLTLMLAFVTGTLWCQPSVLSQPGYAWHKFSVTADGVYKIDYATLQNIGFNPGGQSPQKIQLFGSHLEGMLPQPHTPRNGDLQEIPIHVVDGNDGKLDPGDYLLFFGKGPDRYGIDPSTGKAYYENHLYDDKSYYFLTGNVANGLRLNVVADQGGTHPVVTEYDDIGYYESELTNELRSGRKWYGERFGSTLEYTIRFDQGNVIDGSSIQLLTGMMGKSYDPASFQVFINNSPVANLVVPAIPSIDYAIVGVDIQDDILVNANAVGAVGRSNQDVKVRFTKGSSTVSMGYLDYLLLHTKRSLGLTGDQTIFRSMKSLEQPVTRYTIANAAADTKVWDVTSYGQSVIYNCTTVSGVAGFTAPSSDLRTYVVVSNRSYPGPSYEGTVPSQNLRGTGSTQLLIVTAPEFLSEAERLAAYRRSHSGLQVTVATTTQVYHEFSGGKQDVTAIRDFIKHLYDNGTGLENVLVFGRGSYDYKNRLSFNKNFVPIYQSRNSLDPLKTYASDDYFGFLEDHEGNWGENPAEQHTMEIGVGRIPVKKLEEAKNWVDKIIAYEEDNLGAWRKRILFTADDGDFNLHHNQAEQLTLGLGTSHPEVEVQKVYLDAYAQTTTSAGPFSKPARNALTKAINEGVGIVNFTGHGSELQWMQERIVDQASFDEWKPGRRYPFLVTATCEFGRNDDPGLISSAELALFRQNSGTIGLVTTSRPVFSSTNFTLNNAFYQSLFTRKNGKIQNWGAVFRLTKNASMSGVGNRNFILLGDPSMMPPLGSWEINIDEVTNLTSGSDTLKALSTVRVRGSVRNQGVIDTQFDGKGIVTLYDTLNRYSTLGDENPPFTYALRDNALYRGQVTVQAGLFETTFVLPKGMDPVVDKSVLSAYAYSATGTAEALGAKANLLVGGLEQNPGRETTGPDIELYMGDTTFISGGTTGTNSRIVAILSDESGIDISSFNAQNDILAVLDDTLTISLNAYYTTDIDTYSRGKVDYPIDGLKPGPHLLTLHATDVYGNSSSASLSFVVSDAAGIQIEQWLNYPNPFSASTVFHFKHNRPGEDLEAVVTIFDRMGKLVLTNTYQIGESTYKVDLPPWDGTSPDGNKLAGGLYLMKLSLRSLLDGTKNERIAKVILVN
jgi:hypothetical protein